MPRHLQPIADGLVCHVINRGDKRQQAFFDEGDYFAFLKAISDLKELKRFDRYGHCPMGNLLRPVSSSISRILRSLLVSDTQRHRRFHMTLPLPMGKPP